MRLHYDDTIAAPATIPGTGALTVIRVSGNEAFAITDSVVSFRKGDCSSSEGYTIKYGEVSLPDGTPIDDVLVGIFRAPHSYTGEDSVEISCHASSYIASTILSLLIKGGARMADPGEFTKRAYLNGKMDLSQAEAVADVIAAKSEAAHRVAFSLMKGGFSKELETLRGELLEMTSLLELELDFSEEEVEFASRDKLLSLLEGTVSHVGKLASSFRVGNAIKEGIPVAIVGAANAGKSTLLNALLKEDRAIVSPIPGTTRDTIEETFVLDGVQLRLVDTAGLRDTDQKIEKMGIERTMDKISRAQILLLLLDGTSPIEEIISQADSVIRRTDPEAQKVILVVNKCDITDENKNVTTVNNLVSHIGNESNIQLISAKTGLGLPALEKALSSTAKGLISGASEGTLVSNLRHFQALERAKTALEQAKSSLEGGIPSDLVAEDLREAISCLGEITGMGIDSQEVLNNIFANHCIGK